jgi:hypothetical protein
MSEILKSFITKIDKAGLKRDDQGRLLVPVVASDADFDKVDDRVLSWDLSGYKGAVGMAHDRGLNWAKALDTTFDAGKLKATVRFPIPKSSPTADELAALIEQEIITDLSVVFRPSEDSKLTMLNESGGIDFQQARLIKFDFVDVGMNPRATVQRSCGTCVREEATKIQELSTEIASLKTELDTLKAQSTHAGTRRSGESTTSEFTLKG